MKRLLLFASLALIGAGWSKGASTVVCKAASLRSAETLRRLQDIATTTDTAMIRLRSGYGIAMGLAAGDVLLLTTESMCVRASAAVDTVEQRPGVTGRSVHLFSMGSHYVVDPYSGDTTNRARAVFVFDSAWTFRGYFGVAN